MSVLPLFAQLVIASKDGAFDAPPFAEANAISLDG